MASPTQEYHLLHVEDSQGGRTYYLNAATLSIGRDSSNAIRIVDLLVSRNHAMLIRMPSQTSQYAYQLVDGDVNGRPSKNGVWINQASCRRKMLATGDRIQLGSTRMSYMIACMTPEEYSQYFDAQTITFHSLKEEVLDPTGTLVTALSA